MDADLIHEKWLNSLKEDLMYLFWSTLLKNETINFCPAQLVTSIRDYHVESFISSVLNRLHTIQVGPHDQTERFNHWDCKENGRATSILFI